MLTTRELASLIWIAALVLACLIIPKWRSTVAPSAGTILKLFFSWPTIGIFAGIVLWTGACVFLAHLFGFWEWFLLTDTLLILFGLGFPLLFRAIGATSGYEIVVHIRKETLALSALFVFYLNLETLPLWAELIAQPVFVFLAVLLAVAQRQENGRQVVGCLTAVLVILGLGLLVWTTVRVVEQWGQIDDVALMLQFALSLWLPFALFPYVYGVAFFAATESLLTRLKWLNKGMPVPVQIGIVAGLHLSVRWAKALTGRYHSVSEARTFRQALHAMDDFREDVLRRERREAQRVEDLEAFAGTPGVDGSGAQLDRREFDGTKRALRFIHTAQALRYERQGDRFWDDLTNMVLEPLDRYELPQDHGVVVETTPDRKAWRAWRRLPSGWVLGIGSAGRIGEFLFSAAHAPTGWPPDGAGWVDAARAEWPADWDRDDGPRV